MALGHRVLVPLDGSAFAERVLPIATAVARHAEGRLQLLTVHGSWLATGVPPSVAGIVEEAEREAFARAEAYLGRLVSSYDETGIPTAAAVRSGTPHEEILDACERAECDLIAMATHGRGGFTRLWLGSVADRVVRHSTVPVLLVPSSGREDSVLAEEAVEVPVAPADVKTVIIALDGSDLARQAMVPATALGEAFGAEYVLFEAVPPPEVMVPPAVGDMPASVVRTVRDLVAGARRRLEDEAARLREAGFTVTVAVTEELEPAPALLRLADATPGAVIAMTTHGRGGLGRAVLGSVTDKVVRAARCPVLVVRGGA